MTAEKRRARTRKQAQRKMIEIVEHAYRVAVERALAHGGTEERFWDRPVSKIVSEVVGEMTEAASELGVEP